MNGLDRPPSSQGFTINPAATPINRPPSSQGFVLNPAATPINRPPSSNGRRTYMLPASPAPPSRYQAIIILVTFQFCMMIISWEPEDQYCMWPLGKVSENLPYNQWFAHFVVVVVVFLVKRKFFFIANDYLGISISSSTVKLQTNKEFDFHFIFASDQNHLMTLKSLLYFLSQAKHTDNISAE